MSHLGDPQHHFSYPRFHSRIRTQLDTFVVAFIISLLLFLGPSAFPQNLSSGTIRGTVLDPSGAAVKGATVQIQNPVTGYGRTVQADDQGNFEFANVPFNPYHLSVTS